MDGVSVGASAPRPTDAVDAVECEELLLPVEEGKESLRALSCPARGEEVEEEAADAASRCGQKMAVVMLPMATRLDSYALHLPWNRSVSLEQKHF